MHNLLIAIKSNYARCPGNHKLISLLHQNRNAAYPTTPATVEHENYLHISGRSGVGGQGLGGQNVRVKGHSLDPPFGPVFQNDTAKGIAETKSNRWQNCTA